MENLIRQLFLHDEVLGEHVREGHYDLMGPNCQIILPSVWDMIIEPGWLITMHMWPIPTNVIHENPEEEEEEEPGMPNNDQDPTSRSETAQSAEKKHRLTDVPAKAKAGAEGPYL